MRGQAQLKRPPLLGGCGDVRADENPLTCQRNRLVQTSQLPATPGEFQLAHQGIRRRVKLTVQVVSPALEPGYISQIGGRSGVDDIQAMELVGFITIGW